MTDETPRNEPTHDDHTARDDPTRAGAAAGEGDAPREGAAAAGEGAAAAGEGDAPREGAAAGEGDAAREGDAPRESDAPHSGGGDAGEGAAAPHAGAAPPPRRLTRSGGDAVIGGVGSGLARYFGLDPLLFRIGFVVLTFAGGIGILAYLLLLAFVPSDGEQRPGGTSRTAAVVGAVVLGCALVVFLDTPFFFFGPGVLVIGVLGLIGFLIWRAFGGTVDGDPGRTAGRIVLFGLLGVVIASAAVGVGLFAALGGGVVLASLTVAAGLVLIGTAFVGGARWLIIPALAFVLPLAVVAAADIDLEGGVGERDYRPATMDSLRDTYEIGMGSLAVDLRDLDLPSGRTEVEVKVGIGEAVVYVPTDTCITSTVNVGAGVADVLDRDNEGLDVAVADIAPAPAGRPTLHIDADVGLGAIEVVREGTVPDEFSRDDFRFFDRSEDSLFLEGTGCT